METAFTVSVDLGNGVTTGFLLLIAQNRFILANYRT
jgi:hypothetical protein